MVRSAIDVCLREASARLVVDLNATRHTVLGDGTRLQQVFWNLISNAMKFTGSDGVITVRSSDVDGGRVRVEVSDTGQGIDPAVLPRLFEPFEQGDIKGRRQRSGLGLGLAISKNLVEAHGGSITAFSAGRGGGATFTVELPVVAEGFVPAAGGQRQPSQPWVDAPCRGPSLKVLLVEDHEPTLAVMTRLLRGLGHWVRGADSVASATAAAAQDEFDLIISDLGLPDGTGLDLIRKLKERYAGRAIALTGYGMESDVEESLRAGFAEHLTKPVDFETLDAAIHRVASACQR
jgi:CheY-like chemotaxis protein